jgi:hypothetical protein
MATRVGRPTLVIAGKGNQLANRLFVYAHAMAWAIEHQVTLINPTFGDFAAYFEGCRSDLLGRYPSTPSVLAGDRGRAFLDRAFPSLVRVLRKLSSLGVPVCPIVTSGLVSTLESEGGLVHLDGAEFLDRARRHAVIFIEGPLFRDYADTAKHIAAIRAYFTPIAPVRDRVARYMTMVREGDPVVVGVHVRRSDYRTFVGGAFFYEPRQYAAVMQGVTALFDGRPVRFVVCSDEPVDRTHYHPLDVYSGPGPAVDDLSALASCDYIIGPPSTFSAWASFYGNVPASVITDPTHASTLAEFAVVRG